MVIIKMVKEIIFYWDWHGVYISRWRVYIEKEV